MSEERLPFAAVAVIPKVEVPEGVVLPLNGATMLEWVKKNEEAVTKKLAMPYSLINEMYKVLDFFVDWFRANYYDEDGKMIMPMFTTNDWYMLDTKRRLVDSARDAFKLWYYRDIPSMVGHAINGQEELEAICLGTIPIVASYIEEHFDEVYPEGCPLKTEAYMRQWNQEGNNIHEYVNMGIQELEVMHKYFVDELDTFLNDCYEAAIHSGTVAELDGIRDELCGL